MNITPATDQACPTAPHPAVEFARLLLAVFAPLHRLIGLRATLLGPVAYLLQNRINRAGRRIANLLALLAAGRLPRIRAPRVRAPQSRAPQAPAIPTISRSHGWIVAKLGYQAAATMAHLEHLFRDPAVLSLLAGAPPLIQARLGRSLRPICRQLGVTLPAALQAPPRPPKPRTPKPPRPALPKAKPVRHAHPIYPQRRARPSPFDFPRTVFRTT